MLRSPSRITAKSDKGYRAHIVKPLPNLRGKGVPILSQRLIRETPLYQVWEELWDTEGRGPRAAMKIRVARAHDGSYIGSERDAKFLCDNKGIRPEKSKDENEVASIGYSSKDRKWYGWSHRAIYGFKPGDKVSEGDAIEGVDPGFEVKTEDDARTVAIAFASSVS